MRYENDNIRYIDKKISVKLSIGTYKSAQISIFFTIEDKDEVELFRSTKGVRTMLAKSVNRKF